MAQLIFLTILVGGAWLLYSRFVADAEVTDVFVNGPGEARDADIGIAAGNKRGHLFVRGTNVAVVPEDEMVDTLIEWAEFIMEHGIERALERGDLTAAKEAAERDRADLLAEQGDDANDAGARIELIRRR